MKNSLLLGALVTASLALAGCSGGPSDTTAVPATQVPPPTSPSVPGALPPVQPPDQPVMPTAPPPPAPGGSPVAPPAVSPPPPAAGPAPAPAPAPAPVSCAGQTLNWSSGANSCSAPVAFAAHGGVSVGVDAMSPTLGSASFSCSNGMWSLPFNASCSGAVQAGPAAACQSWSDPTTWGGVLPGANSHVVVPAGQCVSMDLSPPRLASVTVNGTLTFADTADRHLQAGWVLVQGGTLQVGAAAQPFQNVAQITLDAPNDGSNVMPGMGTRGLLVNNGKLLLYGRSPNRAWTRLNATAPAGATALTLAQPVDWNANDEVVIAPTDFYGVGQTDRKLVASRSPDGLTLNLTAGVSTPRWGTLQYPNPAAPTGLSLAPAAYVPPQAPAPAAIDQRAEIGNLTRSIIIQGAAGPDWDNARFGAQTMVMGLTSQVVVDGVQFRRVGQSGLQGRYPMHWHMLSYVAGQPVGDATGHVLRNSVITQSANRCVTIHGTNGVTLQNNICYDIRGHAIFLEDAVERRNLIEGNLVLRVDQPPAAAAFLTHDRFNVASGRAGPSGMWLTHPDNIVRQNAVADINGNGYWLAFPSASIGHPNSLGLQVPPRHALFGTFEDNVAHSVNLAGVHFDEPPVTTAPHGNVEGLTYQPTANGQPASDSNPVVPFALTRITTYKNREGIWNRVNGASYEEWVSADNTSKFFIGSTALSHIRRSLVVGTSLNNANTWQTLLTSPNLAHVAFRGARTVEPPSAFASYHGGVAMQHNTVINFPFVSSADLTALNGPQNTAFGSAPSGAFANDDYYLRPIERSLAQNVQNALIHSSHGRRSTPLLPTFAFAGAIVDYQSLMGPQGWNWVYDTPFFTAPGDPALPACQAVEPAGSNGVTCPGNYFGAEFFVLDRNNEPSYPLMALSVSRRDPGNVDVPIDARTVNAVNPALAASTILPNMRHFAMRQNGVFVLTFPGYRDPVTTVPNFRGPLTDVRMTIGNMHATTDSVVLAVEFYGAQANVFATSFPSYASQAWTGPITDFMVNNPPGGITRRYISRATRGDLLSQPGDAYFYDPVAHLVWIKIQGGLNPPTAGPFGAFSDQTLYRPFFLRITQ